MIAINKSQADINLSYAVLHHVTGGTGRNHSAVESFSGFVDGFTDRDVEAVDNAVAEFDAGRWPADEKIPWRHRRCHQIQRGTLRNLLVCRHRQSRTRWTLTCVHREIDNVSARRFFWTFFRGCFENWINWNELTKFWFTNCAVRAGTVLLRRSFEVTFPVDLWRTQRM